MSANQELQEKMLAYLQDNRPYILSSVAEACDANEWDVVQNLPYEVCASAGPEHFEAIWEGICGWDKCIFCIIHLGTVLEISGKLALGKHGHGYYNLSHADGSCIAGHVKIDDIKGMAFVSLNSHKMNLMHIAFYNNDDKAKFFVFVGRENKENIPAAVDSFNALKEAYCTK